MNRTSTTINATIAILAISAGARGDWSFVPSPNAGDFTNQLFGIQGSSFDNVWAVGVSTNSLLDKPDPLALHWDGSAWTIVPTPNPNSSLQSNRLKAVTVIDGGNAWAVGSSTFGPNTSPLILHWNGTQWIQDDVSGELPAPGSFANAVHALAADDIWAMGQITTGGTGFATLAAHYDGSNWTAFNVPFALFGGLEFQAVHGLVSDDVWAAGFENPGQGIFSPLLSHWDGGEWTSLTPPQPGGGGTLHDITMIASDDVWAVGQSYVAPFGDQPYAVHWDGSSWSVAAMPIFPDGHVQLEGVVARASNDVWVAGTNGDDNGVPRPLVMHYDGVEWQEIEMPDSGGSHEWFHSMTALPSGDLWAVGQFSDGSGTATLTARLSGAVSGDVDGDGDVDVSDLLALLSTWGPCPDPPADCAADFDQSGDIGVNDLLMLLANWG